MTNTSSTPQESQAPIGWNHLPNEIQTHIASFCGIPEAFALASTSKHNYSIATKDSVWSAFASQINCHITTILKFGFQLFTNFSEGRLEEISSQETSMKEIKHLQNYLKARDTLIVWQELAKIIHQQSPQQRLLSTLPNIISQIAQKSLGQNTSGKLSDKLSTLSLNPESQEAIIAQASKFSAWYSQHQTALSQITKLYLNNNNLTSLPPEIGQLAQLQLLDLSNNQLTSLPPEIGQLLQLQGLNLHGNQLTSLPPEIGQLTQLDTIVLDNNKLTSLPPEIGQLLQLRWLNLHSNQLTFLPPQIGQLDRLIQLGLSNNQLTELPSEIGQLHRLNQLVLNNNQLTKLPSEIGQLDRLDQLNLINNQLTELPSEIKKLTECWIIFSGNPISN
ncbi:MAG: E3 ubiquitin-protein ligase sspH2 [Chlamydiae bacterium]|nr:E3 ubiquitin-protein ligase sspH2 [Chlamydiota bacterium]